MQNKKKSKTKYKNKVNRKIKIFYESSNTLFNR